MPLLTTPAAILLIGALIPALWLLTAYRARIAKVGRSIKRATDQPYSLDSLPLPPAVSIIVVAGNNPDSLDRLLNRLYEQEITPQTQTEVIVVNDGRNEDIMDVVTRFKNARAINNLYVTFAPAITRNVSRRKLAITLGIKAAQHPIILLLNEESRPASRQWLARMAAPFASPSTEVVIGSGMPATRLDRGLGARYRSFTHAADTTEWLAATLNGHPWRAHRMNLGFRRDTFERTGGFKGALNLRDGDDDIFISRIAHRHNTTTVTAAQAAVRYNSPTPRTEYSQGRPARFFSSRGLGSSQRRLAALSSLMAWLWLPLNVASITLAAIARQWITLGIAATLFLATWLTLALTWRFTLKQLRSRPALPAIPLYILRRPLTNLRHRLHAVRHKSEYHTWT